ncbi:M48 family metalloprotease [Algimonas porphyrae]|uniref:Peptidase M48 domain-containing protein n=1 Tax=Algimonas porphyrae TaxID=1128113 RepID=A0ABQ5UZC3_9PROT|nr:M48 family metalloprotease [Algimonas porphyrae]GLQ20640.1 hypothetical protein GCM10007854_15950 [Algimonas porphyrae]
MSKSVIRTSFVGPVVLLLLCACSPAQADDQAETDQPGETTDTGPAVDTTSGTVLNTDRLQREPDRYAEFRRRLLDHQARAARVDRISRRLRVANAPLCQRTRLDAGLSVHSLLDYPEGIRPLALHFLPLSERGQSIRSIVPGSPGDRARLQPGETILSGWPIEDDAPLVLRGDEGPETVRLEAELACIAPTYVIASDRLNASTDGRDIELSTALIDQVGDDAGLALIIAHEMSHALRGHTSDMSRWDMELQADGDALILMHNAGYDVATTVASWEAGIEIHRESQSLSATHPPVSIRLQNLQRRLAWIEAAPEGRLDLPDRLASGSGPGR